MHRLIDISMAIRPGMPVWPGSHGVAVSHLQSLAAGDGVTVSRLDMDVHAGTHVEAPSHFIAEGAPLDSLELELFVGPAWVAHVPHVGGIGSGELDAAGIPNEVERLLLRTNNSDRGLAGVDGFDTGYSALTRDGAQWIVNRGVRLIGIDYLSIQRFGDDPETHRVLMRSGIAILEGLDLTEVVPGGYRLICAPLPLRGTEAAPARALLEVLG